MTTGLVLPGEPIETAGLTADLAGSRKPKLSGKFYPLWTIEDGVRRYVVARKMVDRDSVRTDDGTLGLERFVLDDSYRPSDFEPESVGVVNQAAPFDTRGRRTLSLTTNRGPVELKQQVYELRPDLVAVDSTGIDWEYALLTSELSDDSLLAVLDAATERESGADRMRRVRFLIQAERYEMARREMEALSVEFPELAPQTERFTEALPKQYGRKAMQLVRQLKRAGQHRAVQAYCGLLVDQDVGSETLADAEDLLVEYEKLVADRDEALFHLATLEGELDEDLADRVRQIRPALTEELHAETFEKLRPFLRVAGVDGISAEAKLSRAYSAWAVGTDGVTEDLNAALEVWSFRDAVIDLMQAEDVYEFEDRIRRTLSMRAVTPELAIGVLENLPIVLGGGPEPGLARPQRMEMVAEDGTRYVAVVPPEYSPAHKYPAVVALHAAQMTPGQEADWWAGSNEAAGEATRRGVIVIAPAYRDRVAPTVAQSIERVTAVLRDARKRLRIDSDRVFLGGHFEGGDATLTLGFCRPDVWAGIVPIGGRCGPIARRAWENAIGLPVYAVIGGLDDDRFRANALPLESLMIKGSDVVLCEYLSRGRESFSAERPRIFDWMQLHQRRPLQRDFELRVFTGAALEDGVLRMEGIPALKAENPQTSRKVFYRITPSNRAYVSATGQRTTLFLTPEIATFGERMSRKYGTRTVKSLVPEASVETILRDFATRGDRERIFRASVDFE